MARLIDADELYKRTTEWEEQAQDEVNKNKGCRTIEEWDKYKEWLIILNERSSFKFDVADAPTIEAEPIKHGRWIPSKDGHGCECSECGTSYRWSEAADMIRYCKICGARMGGGEDGTA